jgi:hypothetical protein
LSAYKTSLGKGLDFSRDPENQKGAACSEAPVFGREFNCILTRRQVKLAEQQSVQLTQSVTAITAVGLAKPYLASHSESVAIPEVQV